MNKKIIWIIGLILLVTISFFVYQRTAVKDQDIVEVSREVLNALEGKDYVALQNLVSTDGLSLSKGPRLDLSKSDVLKSEVANIPTDSEKKLFGYTDGKGDPIILTTEEFINHWIYNHDYLSPDEVATNSLLDENTTQLNSLVEDIDGRPFTAFNLDGETGYDWTTIYLIFDQEDGAYKLRGIAKNNWSI